MPVSSSARRQTSSPRKKNGCPASPARWRRSGRNSPRFNERQPRSHHGGLDGRAQGKNQHLPRRTRRTQRKNKNEERQIGVKSALSSISTSVDRPPCRS